MKRLYLLRHAKSDHGGLWGNDRERPLNQRGRQATGLIGSYLRRRDLLPELVLCSTAVRARETWEGVAVELATAPPVEHRQGLYLASPDEILAEIGRCDDAVGSVMVIAHNPGLASLALALANGSPPPAKLAKFPTCGLAEFELASPGWEDLQPGRTKLCNFIRPKELTE
ncbi:MAG TPA: histidine phosphatase family protein [Alphaproteobacteria bacterium]|jgi:phosphohistidine phosphatase|nr:histidine phosphatase family protein [Alphaproteobacteria bacterium]MDP6271901.1 histidine phosphatase family protein [Alphaproteobacteria bacterium]MDP7164712.1 histidine phosphatase family protein [Alphaproteobacteria bacterium]MDP7428593.1 histidine phosphatase family protein [Alphaproteobacteria bacterium]HJM52239.1 histidine phosphatase family protein [Alphaproteobacteria bacterium]